ncbi:hypothetical protein ACFPRL_08600 [Pseudoclavibacter helvolus]
MTCASETSSMTASSCAGYIVIPRLVVHSSNASNIESASYGSGRRVTRPSLGSGMAGAGAEVPSTEVIASIVPRRGARAVAGREGDGRACAAKACFYAAGSLSTGRSSSRWMRWPTTAETPSWRIETP